MRSWRLVLLAAAIVCCSAPAIAQKALGELLDAGATKLSKQQVLDTLNDATVSGARPDGGTYQAVYKADGTYTGTYQGGVGTQGIAKGGGYFGKWTVDDSGKFCAEGTSGSGRPVATCGYMFRLGDEYYGSASESNRSAPAFRRVIKR